MSSYVNIYSDFPTRCQEVWERLERSPKNSERDLSVTAMLMAAAAGFATPFEHLRNGSRSDKEPIKDHPAFQRADEGLYKSTKDRVNKVLSEPLVKSSLFTQSGVFPWKLGKCEELKQVRDVAEYGHGTTVNPSVNGLNAEFLLSVLRNALAHNSICAFGSLREIERLSFFSEKLNKERTQRVGWNVATVNVDDFSAFLKEWFKLIKEPHLRLVLSDSLDERATA